jgi:1-acyl-sn-glycerol-3-phosphate acyltransferase
MILLRSLIFQLFFYFSVIFFGLTISLLGRWIPINKIDSLANLWGESNIKALKYLCNLSFRIRGLENLPKSAAIIACKHQSAWETIALRALLPSTQTWVVKKELVRIPFFGAALRALKAIPIDRSAGLKALKQLIRDGSQALREGRFILIFPEGTRVQMGTRGNYNIGAALLAERSGYPLIPIAHNAGVFWGRRNLIKKPGIIDIVIGEKIISNGLSVQEINYQLEEWIETSVLTLPIS